MNLRLKEAVVFVALALYACLIVGQVDGHDSQRPHTHADMIVVSTTAFNNVAGVTNDLQTNANLQTVLDAFDNSTLPSATNITVNTNDWQWLDPTNDKLQQTLDFIDDNALTNLQKTNRYPSWAESSNSFIGSATASGLFISSSGGQVSNQHMGANAITSSNVANDSLTTSDLAGDIFKEVLGMRATVAGTTYNRGGTNTTITHTGIGSPWIAAQNTNNASLVHVWAYITGITAGAANRYSSMKFEIWVSTNTAGTGTTNAWGEFHTYTVNLAGGGSDASVPGSASFLVPAGGAFRLLYSPYDNMAGLTNWWLTWASYQSSR